MQYNLSNKLHKTKAGEQSVLPKTPHSLAPVPYPPLTDPPTQSIKTFFYSTLSSGSSPTPPHHPFLRRRLQNFSFSPPHPRFSLLPSSEEEEAKGIQTSSALSLTGGGEETIETRKKSIPIIFSLIRSFKSFLHVYVWWLYKRKQFYM